MNDSPPSSPTTAGPPGLQLVGEPGWLTSAELQAFVTQHVAAAPEGTGSFAPPCRVDATALQSLADQQLTVGYRILDAGDTIARGDELLADDAVTWLPLAGWEVGRTWHNGLVPMRRRVEARQA
ncbi:hypothetical protein D3C71_21000 [compost metagenome]